LSICVTPVIAGLSKAVTVKTKAELSRVSEEKKKIFKVTFVELGSVRCIPCKMMQPVMEEIEKEYGDQVQVVFHDVWTSEGSVYGEKYRVRAIPTQVFLDKNGKEYFRHQGFFPKEEIIKVLQQQGVK
jgi:thioredoxin 1